MNTWYQMWGKTYQCQISNAGGWFICVRFSKFHDLSMTFDDISKFHDFPWYFQKILVFQVFQTLWELCGEAFNMFLWHQFCTCRLIATKTCAIWAGRIPKKYLQNRSFPKPNPCHLDTADRNDQITKICIESIKTTSMEDVSTRVLEKIKNI